MSTLRELSEKYGTVKMWADHWYGPIYERIMEPVRNTTMNIVEIGIDNGYSAKMWLEYFPNAHVYGIDNDQRCTRLFQHPRWHALYGNQDSRGVWNNVPDDVDFVIDDGSHYPWDQISTLQQFFYKVKSNGFWFIEDCQTSFMPRYVPQGLGIFAEVLNRMIELQTFGYGYADFYRARKDNISGLGPLGRNVYGIQVYKSLVIFEKAIDIDTA